MIRVALAAAAMLAASQAQAGQDVPSPRPIGPIQPVFAAAPSPDLAAPRRWREGPPVMDGWSGDRYIPVVGFDQASACDDDDDDDDGWADEAEDYAAFDADGFPEWEDMR